MAKILQQIKDEYAKSQGYRDWIGLMDNESYFEISNSIDQIAILYSKEQNKEIQDWKDSMMKIHNELDLQGIGKALGLPLGSSISPQVLPKIKELVEQNKEFMKMLVYLDRIGGLGHDTHERIRRLIHER